MNDWRTILEEHFPPPDDAAAESRWAELLERHNIGDTVTGRVIAKAHFGAWIDISVGFPALLELPYIRGLTPEKYRADEWCPLDSSLSAVLIGLAWDPGSPQIRLAQVKQDYAEVSSEERERINGLFAGLKSLDEVIAKIGLPTLDLPEGVVESDGRRYRRVEYHTLSETSKVIVVAREDRLEVEIRPNHLGETDWA